VWNREDLRTKLVVLGPPLGPNADRRNEVRLALHDHMCKMSRSCVGSQELRLYKLQAQHCRPAMPRGS
jgi:hypothetical protein